MWFGCSCFSEFTRGAQVNSVVLISRVRVIGGLITFMLNGSLFFSRFFRLELVGTCMVWLTLGRLVVTICIHLSDKAYFVWISLLLVVAARFIITSLLNFFVIFELSLVPIAIIILLWGHQPERISAILSLVMYTMIISIPYLIMVIIFSLKWRDSSVIFVSGTLGSLIFLRPFLVKMPVLGLHYWLPKAHVEASTRGSIILARILLKLGSYGVLRIRGLVIANHLVLLWLVRSVLASIMTSNQSDIKKLVALSRVTHITFLMVGLCFFNKRIIFVVILVSLVHGWASAGLFFMRGLVSHAALRRLSRNLRLESRLHYSLIFFGILLLANASVPPTPSFFGEILLIMPILQRVLLAFILFILIRFVIGYYNTLLYLWMSQVKSSYKTSGKIILLEGLNLYQISSLIAISLLFLGLLWSRS